MANISNPIRDSVQRIRKDATNVAHSDILPELVEMLTDHDMNKQENANGRKFFAHLTVVETN